MADKLSPEDLAVWLKLYSALLAGMVHDWPNPVENAAEYADNGLAQYKARQEGK